MKKLIMCQGLPGSGKSTWAEEQRLRAFEAWDPDRPDDLVVLVVNKDAIRRQWELGGWVWSRENEKAVVKERDARIQHSLLDWNNVIVISDDTNFGYRHKTRLEQLAREAGAEFEIKRFDVPVAECIRRDALRLGKAQVGETVIRGMAHQFGISASLGYPPAAPLLTPVDAPYAIICDLDGTLSLFKEQGHRGPYDASRCAEDDVNVPVRTLLEIYYRTQHDHIIYLSGREDTYRTQTETFLRGHHCPPGALYMRQGGDHRKDWVVKGELFDAHVRGRYNVRFVLDDRNQVVDYWRHIGLTCFQVAPGAF